MRQKILDGWGAELNDAAFACALAALGILTTSARQARAAELTERLKSPDLASTIAWAAGNNTLVQWKHPDSYPSFWKNLIPDPNKLADAWLEFRLSRYTGIRLSLTASTIAHPPRGVGSTGLPALLALLTHPETKIDALSVAWGAQRRAGWHWPLRLGLLDDTISKDVCAQLGLLYPANTLAGIFPFSRRESHCDIAVLPASPKEHLEHILVSPYGERAGLVLFTSSTQTISQDNLVIFRKIAKEMRSSGFCSISCSLQETGNFVNQVIYNLSHDMPLDVALFYAARNLNVPPPLLFMDPGFCKRTQLSIVANTMARTLVRAGEAQATITPGLSQRIGISTGVTMTALAAGRAMSETMSSFAYAGESHEASDLAEAKQSLDALINEVNSKRGDPRYIQAQIDKLTAKEPGRARALVAGTKHRVQIRIGPFEDRWINPTNRTPFPDELLPADEDEHRLRVILSEPYHIAAPLVTEVKMKSTGPSGVATLEFEPRAGNTEFHARITVAHRNRILQTAILKARVLSEGEQERSDDRITIEIEAIVRAALNDLSGRSRFDLALAFNHTTKGQPTVFSLADKHAVLKTMNKDVMDSIGAIGDCLSEVAKVKSHYAGGLEGKEGVALLRFLATEGRSLYDYFIHDQAVPIFGKKLSSDEAAHIQIVSLSPDAYFPAEFIYEFGVPTEEATVCPVALKAFKNNDYSHRCTSKDHEESNNQHVCPFGFWGLQRVVERHAFLPLEDDSVSGQYVLQTEPCTGRNVLEVTMSALFAASNEVDKEEARTTRTLLDRLSVVLKTPVEFAAKWEDWTKGIATQGPGVLIVLPHVKTEWEHTKPYYYLEIGGDFLKANAIDASYVKKNKETYPPPLVILLGCDTAVPQTEMDSIVGRFRRAGAVIVVGTVASVLGSHASSVAEEILTDIVSLGVGNEVPFGELLLSARRRAVGRGLLMAMCVGGFGDADWLIKT